MTPPLRSAFALALVAFLLPPVAAAGLDAGPQGPGPAAVAGEEIPDEALNETPAEAPDDGYTVFLCPMHRDYQSSEPARCALCGMPLVRRTLVTRYVCLADETDSVVSETPGICPATGEPLAPTTREVAWYCPGEPTRLSVEPRPCADGAASVRTTRRAEHGDHNPRHGGVLFMAADGVHHLEGVFAEGAFRLWFYDSFTRPISPEGFAARVVAADDRGAPTADPVALAVGAGGALEAAVASAPEERASFTAFVRFPDREEEDRFDFVFLPEAERARLAAEFGSGSGGEAGSGGGLPELRVPDSREAILAEIRARDLRVQNLIAAGRWADLFIPALEAKTLALAYGDRFGAEEPRPWVAIKRIVRGAWLLDLHGDAGDRTRVEEAYRIFAEGMSGLGAGGGGRP